MKVCLKLALVIVIFFIINPMICADEGSQSMDLTKFKRWKHFSIADPLPGSSWGTGGIGLADFNGDGYLEVVISRRETKTAYWFERKDDANWIMHTINESPYLEKTLGGIALDIDLDIENDGNLEIFAGEQEDPDTYMVSSGKLPMKPNGLKERGVIWVNIGGKNPIFEPVVIHKDNPGWHDAVVGDINKVCANSQNQHPQKIIREEYFCSIGFMPALN